MAVEASIVVEFGDSASENGIIQIEIDDAYSTNIDSSGNVISTFPPSISPVFLIHHSPDIRITDVLCTDGSVAKIGEDEYRERETDVLFTTKLPGATSDDNITDTGYYFVTLNEVEWFGNTGTVYADMGELKIETATIPCSGNVKFSVLFQEQYQLTPPVLELVEDESYTIYVVIYVESVGE